MIKEIQGNQSSPIPTEEFSIKCFNGEFIKPNATALNWKTGEQEILSSTSNFKDLVIPLSQHLNLKDDNSRYYTVLDTDIIITEDYNFGQFLGIFAGDGWWDKPQYKGKVWSKRQLHLADVPGENYQFIENFLVNHLKVKNYKVTSKFIPRGESDFCIGDSRKFSMRFDGCNQFCDLMASLLGGERGENHNGAGNKRLNLDLENINYDFKKGIIAGLLSSDGCIHINTSLTRERLGVSLTTISEQLAKDIVELCKTCNIRASIHHSKRLTKSHNEVYVVIFGLVDLKLNNFLDQRMASTTKFKIYDTTNVSLTDTKYNHIPFTQELSNWIKPFLYFRKLTKINKVNPTEEEKKLIKDARIADGYWDASKTGYITKRFFIEDILPAVQKDILKRQRNFMDAVIELQRLIRFDDIIFTKEIYTKILNGFNSCVHYPILKSERDLYEKFQKLLRNMYISIFLQPSKKPKSLKSKFHQLLDLIVTMNPLSINPDKLKLYMDLYVNNPNLKWTFLKP